MSSKCVVSHLLFEYKILHYWTNKICKERFMCYLLSANLIMLFKCIPFGLNGRGILLKDKPAIKLVKNAKTVLSILSIIIW